MGDKSSNVTQILTSFESFIKVLEDPDWTRSAKIEDIKTAFKLGSFLEKTIEHFQTQNSLEQFLCILKKWLNNKDRTKVYSENVYAVACDELIIKFFSCTNISEVNLDIAVRVYTSIFPKSRFEKALTKALLNAGNLEALSDYMKIFSAQDTKCLEYHLKLQNWDLLMQKGQTNNIKEEIENMLTPYNVEFFLDVLIGILSLAGVSSEEKSIQNIVLVNVLEKMSERSILTKELWTAMFKTIEIKSICGICINFCDFLNTYLNFIVYTGSMMSKVGSFWKSDPNICFYPNVEYEDILNHLFELCKVSDNMKQIIFGRINEAKEFTGSDIWDQILIDLNEK